MFFSTSRQITVTQTLGSVHVVCSFMLWGLCFSMWLCIFSYLQHHWKVQTGAGNVGRRQRCQWQLCNANGSCRINMLESRSVNMQHRRQETLLRKKTLGAQEASSDEVVKTSELLWVSNLTLDIMSASQGAGSNCASWDHKHVDPQQEQLNNYLTLTHYYF